MAKYGLTAAEYAEHLERIKQIQRIAGVNDDGDFGPKSSSAVLTALLELEQALGGRPAAAPKPTRERTIAEIMVDIARTQVGVVEKGGNNKGPEVQKYQSATWLAGTGWAWCAAFICWLFEEAEKVLEPKSGWQLPFREPDTAGAWDFENWAKGKYGPVPGVKLLKPANGDKIQAGDILIYTFSHIGIAEAGQTGTTVRTIEGNTNSEGSREGDGVYEKTRKVSQVRSFIRITA